MSAKHPEPSDYPSWLSQLLFDPKEVYKRTYCGNTNSNLKALHNLWTQSRAQPQAGLMFDTCIQTELNRIELVKIGVIVSDLIAQNKTLRITIIEQQKKITDLSEEVSGCKKKKVRKE